MKSADWNDIPDAHWRAFFGRNANYYMRQLERVRQGHWPSFHWEAFLLGYFWILYRRMYLVAVCTVILMAVETTIEEGLIHLFDASWEFQTILARVMALVYGIAMGAFANHVHLWHARRCIRSVTAKRAVHVEEVLLEDIRKQGGTSWSFIIIVLALLALALVFFNILDFERQF